MNLVLYVKITAFQLSVMTILLWFDDRFIITKYLVGETGKIGQPLNSLVIPILYEDAPNSLSPSSYAASFFLQHSLAQLHKETV